MNGAAMKCREEQLLHSQHQNSSDLHRSGYHLHQPNIQPQHSKDMNFQLFSNSFEVGGYSGHLQELEIYRDSRHFTNRDVRDPRIHNSRTRASEPLDLPVPLFEIDEHSVSNKLNVTDVLVKNAKALDLDTRIDLLIKSKALAGMHPIFSDLNESEGSSSDSDDLFINSNSKLTNQRNKHAQQSQSKPQVDECLDDPEKPLSRPPSPFLSRATYLFWFNKAIEIKQQAKAQEQALLEKATKRLLLDSSTLVKENDSKYPCKLNSSLLNSLLDEINKEFKDFMKQEFIREVLEEAAYNKLDDWLKKQENEDQIYMNQPNMNCTVLNSNSNKASCQSKEEFSHVSTSPKLHMFQEEGILQSNILLEKKFNSKKNDHHVNNKENLFKINVQENSQEKVPDLFDKNITSPPLERGLECVEKVSNQENLKKNNIMNEMHVSLLELEPDIDTTYINNEEKHTNINHTNLETSASTGLEILSDPNHIDVAVSSSLFESNNDIIKNKTVETSEIVKDIVDILLNNINNSEVQRSINEKEELLTTHHNTVPLTQSI